MPPEALTTPAVNDNAAATPAAPATPNISNGNGNINDHESPELTRAKRLLRMTPLIDGHNDFPFLLRQQLHNQIYQHDLRDNLACHTSISKMRKGMMGGQFWSIYVPNPEELRLVVPGDDDEDGDEGDGDGPRLENGGGGGLNGHCCGCENVVMPTSQRKKKKSSEASRLGLNEPNHAVRDTLEQIDITHRLINAYPTDLTLCTTPSSVRAAHSRGVIASMLGVEGGHSTGNSLAPLRLFFSLGVRYMTLTHNSDNAFGTSWISVDPAIPGGASDPGLTVFGEHCVREMNRLGMLVDISHVSPNTMRRALEVSRAPVMFSHSAAWSVTRHGRNVPDDVLRMLKRNGGVVMVPSVAVFLRGGEGADVETVMREASVDDLLDHVLYIADLIGWEHVGLGSDFDGSLMTVRGLEDTSQFPNLIARLIARQSQKKNNNITDTQVRGLIGENILRVWEQAEKVAEEMQSAGALPCEEHWEGRIWEEENLDVPRVFASGRD